MTKLWKDHMAANQIRSGLEGQWFKTLCLSARAVHRGILVKIYLPLVICLANINSRVRSNG